MIWKYEFRGQDDQATRIKGKVPKEKERPLSESLDRQAHQILDRRCARGSAFSHPTANVTKRDALILLMSRRSSASNWENTCSISRAYGDAPVFSHTARLYSYQFRTAVVPETNSAV